MIAISAVVTAASLCLITAIWVWRSDPPQVVGGFSTHPKPGVTEGAGPRQSEQVPAPNDESIRQGEFNFGPEVQTVQLGDFGTAQFEGPGRAQWLTSHRLRLLKGGVRIRIDLPAGYGFSVETPGSTVTDLGTEFGVGVASDQSSTVAVFQGAVELRPKVHDEGAKQPVFRLYAGDGLRVSSTGSVQRLMAIVTKQGSAFSQVDGDLQQDPAPLILDVRDNVLGLDSHRFYEIVVGGLREDAKAYVDRPKHEWNGLNEEGLPEFLMGIDYVKTFNEDKQRRHLSLELKLTRPANLYVFFDARQLAPDWLTDGFRDTGERIGLDMGPWRGPDGRLMIRETAAIGPGQSIDAEFTIWVRRVEQAGVVRLGPAAGSTGLSSMYGIAAAELPSD